jgi:FkbM family methyltransferase
MRQSLPLKEILSKDAPLKTPEQSRVAPWFLIDGDNNLRVNYSLTSDSVVYDVGGYRGDWAREIYKRYNCYIDVFEPVQAFVVLLNNEFGGNDKITIHPFGLSGKNEKNKINLDEASSSTFKSGDNLETIKLKAASEFIGKKHTHIDLIKINIEGGEYALLDNLIKSGLIKNISNIQVQFHIFVPGAAKKRRRLQGLLSKTHELTYSYPWIWENWRLKP